MNDIDADLTVDGQEWLFTHDLAATAYRLISVSAAFDQTKD